MTDNVLKAGSLVCFSSGEYSDYGMRGHFVLLEDLTPERVAEAVHAAKESQVEAETKYQAWKSDDNRKYEDYPRRGDVQEAFIAELIRKGLLASITCTEIHIGSYGELDVDHYN